MSVTWTFLVCFTDFYADSVHFLLLTRNTDSLEAKYLNNHPHFFSLLSIFSMDYVSIGCCTLAFGLYVNTLGAGFVYDDR